MGRLARLRQVADRFRDLVNGSNALEERALLALYNDDATVSPLALKAAAVPLNGVWEELLLTLYCRESPHANRATLALFCEDPGWLIELAGAYVGAAKLRGLTIDMLEYRLSGGKQARDAARDQPEGAGTGDESAEPPKQYWRNDRLYTAATARQPERELLVREVVKDQTAFLASRPARLPGIVLDFRGLAAAPRLMPEAGLHVLRAPRLSQPVPCLVETSDVELSAYLPPPGITRRGAIGTQNRRRIYDRVSEVLDDLMLAMKLPWGNRALSDVLAEAIEQRLRRGMAALLEE